MIWNQAAQTLTLAARRRHRVADVSDSIVKDHYYLLRLNYYLVILHPVQPDLWIAPMACET